MKRLVVLFILLWGTALTVGARPVEASSCRDEVSLSYSLLGIGVSKTQGRGGILEDALTGGRTVTGIIGPVLLEYYHTFSRVFALGAGLDVRKTEGNLANNAGFYSIWSLGLSPSARFTWFQHPLVHPYSRISLGLGYMSYSENGTPSKSTLSPEIQLTPFGLLLGRGRIRWMFEIGGGTYGWCLTGLNYRF